MPYVLVRGNLASYGQRQPWRVLVSGLKASELEQMDRFASGGYTDESTIVYLQHPCVILTALEVLGYKVVASSSTSVKQDYNEYMWTLRKDFAQQQPMTEVDDVFHQDGSSDGSPTNEQGPAENPLQSETENLQRKLQLEMASQLLQQNDLKMEDLPSYLYVAVKGSLHANDCAVFGLNSDEIQALTKRYQNSSAETLNGVIIKVIVANTAINFVSYEEDSLQLAAKMQHDELRQGTETWR